MAVRVHPTIVPVEPDLSIRFPKGRLVASLGIGEHEKGAVTSALCEALWRTRTAAALLIMEVQGRYGRACVITFFLQIDPSMSVDRAREWPRVLQLMYPSRTRARLSVIQTDNKSSARQRELRARKNFRCA